MNNDSIHNSVNILKTALQDKLRKDYELYCENILYVTDRDTSVTIPFKINASQRKINQVVDAQYYAKGYSRTAVLKGRRTGGSAYGTSKAKHRSLSRPVNYFLLAQQSKTAKSIFMDMLSPHFKNKMDKELFPQEEFVHNTEMIKVGNHTFSYGTVGIGGEKNSQGGARGMKVDFWHATEVGYYKTIDVISTLNSIPSQTGEILAESTANGQDNMLYEIYMESKREGSEWKFVDIPWFEDSGYVWKGDLSMYEPSEFVKDYNSEYCRDSLTLGQLKWLDEKYISHAKSLYWLNAEFPPSAEVAFSQSFTNSLISPFYVDKALEEKVNTVFPNNVVSLGIDVGLTRDKTIICINRGNQLFKFVHVEVDQNSLDTSFRDITRDIIKYIKENILNKSELFLDNICIDRTGLGEGLYQECVRELPRYGINCVVEGVIFSKNDNPKMEICANNRAFMFHNLQEVFQGQLPISVITNDGGQRIRKELLALTTNYKTGKLLLDRKDVIKEVLGFSPDYSDAMALSVYFPSVGKIEPNNYDSIDNNKYKNDNNPYSYYDSLANNAWD